MTTPSPPPTGLEPTQTRRPWRATLRTALAVGIPAILLLPSIIQAAIEELGPALPPAATRWLVAAGVVVTAIASLITRILAFPQVELLLRRLPAAAFAAQPKPKPADNERDTSWGASTLEVAAIVVAVVVVVAFVVWVLPGGAR